MADLVVLTGATGLIGSTLGPVIARTRPVLALSPRAPHGADGTLRWLECDLSQPSLPADMPSEVDTVIHLAQSRHFRHFPDSADDIFAVNVGSTTRLLDWARRAGARRFIYASSGGIYGHGDSRFKEDEPLPPPGPLGFYLATKKAAELLVEPYEAEFTVVILRPFFVYGRGQREEMLIPRLVRSVIDGRPITLQGSDGITINPVHVSDAVRAVARCLELEQSHTINIAGPEALSLRSIGEIIGDAVGRRPHFVDQPGEPRHLVGDVTKMTRLLGAPERRFADEVGDLCPVS
jgi:UDP-glucose 4-epimerase